MSQREEAGGRSTDQNMEPWPGDFKGPSVGVGMRTNSCCSLIMVPLSYVRDACADGLRPHQTFFRQARSIASGVVINRAKVLACCPEFSHVFKNCKQNSGIFLDTNKCQANPNTA